jgi:hypothetical protein
VRRILMPENSYEEKIYTEDIEDLVEQILRKISRPYPQDITDQVFLAIENDKKLLHYYTIYAGSNAGAANAFIGKMVKEITGLKVKGTCRNPKSKLIKSYKILGY